MDTYFWEHFLPDKPQRGTLGLKHNENETIKNLEMPNSWVTVIQVPVNSKCFILKKHSYFLTL